MFIFQPSICLLFLTSNLLLIPNGSLTLETLDESDDSPQNSTAELTYRRAFILNMTLDAWSAYARTGLGSETILPLTNRPSTGGIPGRTALVSLTTLWIMDLKAEFNQAKRWLIEEADFRSINRSLSVADVVSDVIGSLISTYSLTGDRIFLEKAAEAAEAIQHAYRNDSGLAYSKVNPQMVGQKMGAFPKLSSIGQQLLEYRLLSRLTRNSSTPAPNRSTRFLAFLHQNQASLFSNQLHIQTEAESADDESEFTLLSDNRQTLQAFNVPLLYGSLLKLYIASNRTNGEALALYRRQMEVAGKLGLFGWSASRGLTFVRDRVKKLNGKWKLEERMELYACALGGILALGAQELEMTTVGMKNQTEKSLTLALIRYHKVLSVNITETCRITASRTKTGLPLAQFTFPGVTPNTSTSASLRLLSPSEYPSLYMLTPELAESYLTLYRLTRNESYRDAAWALASSLVKYARTDSGYVSFRNTDTMPPALNDYQPAVLLGATLKYLYLIFSEPTLLPLDRWVLNSAGQPLPIKA